MKNKKIILISFCAFFLLCSGILAGCSSRFFRTDTSVSQGQLDYLKKHQDEIKDFIKEQNSKIESVEIDWSQTQWSEIGNGTPQGGGEGIDVYGTFNNNEKADWHVFIELVDGKPDMKKMMIVNGLRINGEYFE